MGKFFQNTEFQLDEILFNGRNKEYGAYALRTESNRILTKAMFVGLSFFAAVTATPFIISNLNPQKAIPKDDFSGHGFVEVPIVPDKPDPVKPADPVKLIDNQKTIDTSVPTPVAELTKTEKPGVKVEDYNTAVPGLVDKDGDAPTITVKPPVFTIPTNNGGGKVVDPVVPKPVSNDPVIPDVEAKFDGGINAFRDKFLNQFDGSSFDGSGETIKTTLTFIVEKDGSISNIKADGKDASFNSEAIRAVKSIRGKWSAGKLQGSSVRSYFKFPVSMNFE